MIRRRRPRRPPFTKRRRSRHVVLSEAWLHSERGSAIAQMFEAEEAVDTALADAFDRRAKALEVVLFAVLARGPK